MSQENFAFVDAEKTQNNRLLANLIPKISGLRPSMVRRLQRANDKTTCFFITEGQPESKAVVSASKIPENKHPIVSWLVPNTKGKEELPYEFCFSVNEVQQFIANHVEENNVPMFGHKQIQDVVGVDVIIDNVMPREFRFVFEEYHLLPYSQEKLKEDTITKAAIDVVERYVQNKVQNEDSSKSLGYTGHFWKFTKQYVNVALNTVTTMSGKILTFVLGNPWWTSIIKMLAKVLRVAICAASSFLGDTVQDRNKVLEMIKNRFVAQMGRLAHGPMIILDIAKAVIPKLLPLTQQPKIDFNIVTDENVKSYRVFATLATIIQNGIEYIMGVCGLSFVMRLPKLVLQDSIVIFKLVLNPSTIQRFDLRAFNTLDFDFLGMVLLFDVLSTLYTSAKPFFDFALRFFGTADRDMLRNALTTKIDNRQFTWLGVVDLALQNNNLRHMFQDALQELYFWIMDVFPCLFQYFVRNLRAFLLFGIVAPQETNASCCLRDVVMSMQKEAVLYGNERGEAENAQAAAELAMPGSTATQKQRSWLDYVLRRPFAVDETKTQINNAFAKNQLTNKDWSELNMELGSTTAADKPAAESPNETLTAETPDLETHEDKLLWAAQCGMDQQSHVFPNPVFVYKRKLPFYFQNTVNDESRLCVAPDAADIQRHYPNTVWNFNGQSYVLLHRVPDDVMRHMATMRTPLFSFRAT